MRAAMERYHALGLYAIERSSAAAMDRLATAAQQLPDAKRPVRLGFRASRTTPSSRVHTLTTVAVLLVLL